MITMLDTVTPSAIGRLASTSPDAVAGYDDGWFNDIAQLEHDYPGHKHLAIAVHPWDDGDCLDIETGDARPSDAPGWLRRQHARGIARPWLYANTSTWPAVTGALRLAGIGRNEYIKWRADFDGEAVLLDDDDAKQYSDHWEGRNVDVSVVREEAFALPRPKKPPKRRRRPTTPAKQKIRRARPHPKVAAGAGAGGLGTALVAILAAAGVHITPAEAAAIATVAGSVAGYLTPARRP